MSHRRKRPPRCPGYDYRRDGLYFVTVCTQGRVPRLGRLEGGTLRPSAAGRIVLATWCRLPEHYGGVFLDAFCLMPDHVHAVVGLHDAIVPLMEVVRAFKTFSARGVNADDGTPAVAARLSRPHRPHRPRTRRRAGIHRLERVGGMWRRRTGRSSCPFVVERR